MVPLEITKQSFLGQKGGVIMPGEYELSVFITKGANSANVLSYIPEMRIIQPQ
jgi:hypothetical protein